MNDDLQLIVQLRPDEPLLSAGELAELRARIFDSAQAFNSVDPSAHLFVARVTESSVPRTDWRRVGLRVAAGLLIVAGAAATWAALGGNSTQPSARVPSTAILEQVPAGPAPSAAQPFEFKTSSSEATTEVELTLVDGQQACVRVVYQSTQSETCFDADTVSAGWAYGFAGGPGEPPLVFGVVPDGVDTVELSDTDIELRGNVWSGLFTSSEPAELRVASTITGVEAHPIFIEHGPTISTTTTTPT